jgi:hypothetical protein
MVSVVVLGVAFFIVWLSIVMLIVIMLIVIMLGDIMLSDVVPNFWAGLPCHETDFNFNY